MADGRRFTLQFENAAEDIPRQIRVYARLGKGSECALVLRPKDRTGLLVHLENGSAWRWLAEAGSASDAPQRPETPVAHEDAVRAVKEQKRNPGPLGPISLRGNWSGHLVCDNGRPRLELQRKVASYGVLHLTSQPEGKWAWKVERLERWFSRPGAEQGTAKHLAEAIQTGLAQTMRLLGEACSVRDSRRRAALDHGYAAQHPLVPAKEKADSLEQVGTKSAKAARKSKPKKEASSPVPTAVTPASGGATQPVPRVRKPKPVQPAAGIASSPPPAAQPSAPPTRRSRGTSAGSGTSVGTSGYEPPEVDPAKDKLLLDAFSQAMANVLGQLGAA